MMEAYSFSGCCHCNCGKKQSAEEKEKEKQEKEERDKIFEEFAKVLGIGKGDYYVDYKTYFRTGGAGTTLVVPPKCENSIMRIRFYSNKKLDYYALESNPHIKSRKKVLKGVYKKDIFYAFKISTGHSDYTIARYKMPNDEYNKDFVSIENYNKDKEDHLFTTFEVEEDTDDARYINTLDILLSEIKYKTAKKETKPQSYLSWLNHINNFVQIMKQNSVPA